MIKKNAVPRQVMFDAKHRAKDNELKNQPGIYRIVNIHNGHCYVGQSVDLAKRKKDHFRALLSESHTNQYLQNAFNYYGSTNFYFEVIEYCAQSALNEREEYWFGVLNPEYNIARSVFQWAAELDKERINRTSGEYTKSGETFTRPGWHKVVYGGCKDFSD